MMISIGIIRVETMIILRYTKQTNVGIISSLVSMYGSRGKWKTELEEEKKGNGRKVETGKVVGVGAR